MFCKESSVRNLLCLKYNVKVINMTADIVAKNDFLMMKSFRHSYGCSLCLTECSYFSKRPVYPSAKECVFRTRDSIVDDVNYVVRNINLTDSMHGHTKNLPLFYKYIMYPYTITVDWFHSVLQGTFHDDMKNIFVSGFSINNHNFKIPPLENYYKENLDYIVENNKISRCFARKPRKLKFFDSYKANEMKLFFLYIFPLSTYLIINSGDNEYSRYVLNIFLQISSVGSLLNTNLASETIEFIESVLFKCHDNRTQVISKNHYSKIKSHDITHLAYVAKYHGSINCFSTFAEEASLHDLHSLLSSLSMENVLTQITKRLDDKWLIFEKPKFSISDIQESVVNVELPEYVRNNFTNEVRVLKNTIYLSILSKGKIINRMTSNLENDVIDQDCYIYVKEEYQEHFKPYIIEYIVIDNINNVFFTTREILTSGSIEKYIIHSDLEITNLIKQTNFFKNHFEVKSIEKNIKMLMHVL
uniref:DNA-directed RNA polymerase n=1 Tax=Strongyloides venezuelensis TaxID=75913 RepID=A0A0K0FPM9_STRVS